MKTASSPSPRLHAALALLLAASFAAHAAPAYVAHEVLGPGGLKGLIPNALNDAGTVGGQTGGWKPSDGFLLKAGGGYTTFEAFAPGFTTVWGLNAQGDAAGFSQTDLGDKAFLKPRGKAPIDLFERESGALGSYAYDVNANDVVVGTFYSPDYVAHAFSWTAGVLKKLPSLGGTRTVAVAVNDAGVIAGISHLPRTQGGHAVKWVDGVLVDLGGLGYTNFYGDETYDINTAGWIAGSCATAGNNPRGCIWHDGVIDELSTLEGGTWSVAYGINDHNVVVGRAAYPNTAGHAVIWKKGAIADLNELVALPDQVVLQQADAINAKGQILVYGFGVGGERWFVLVPAGAF